MRFSQILCTIIQMQVSNSFPADDTDFVKGPNQATPPSAHTANETPNILRHRSHRVQIHLTYFRKKKPKTRQLNHMNNNRTSLQMSSKQPSLEISLYKPQAEPTAKTLQHRPTQEQPLPETTGTTGTTIFSMVNYIQLCQAQQVKGTNDNKTSNMPT